MSRIQEKKTEICDAVRTSTTCHGCPVWFEDGCALDSLEQELSKQSEGIYSELYQIVGVLHSESGDDRLIKVMDNLSDAQSGRALRHKTLLPFNPAEGNSDTELLDWIDGNWCNFTIDKGFKVTSDINKNIAEWLMVRTYYTKDKCLEFKPSLKADNIRDLITKAIEIKK